MATNLFEVPEIMRSSSNRNEEQFQQLTTAQTNLSKSNSIIEGALNLQNIQQDFANTEKNHKERKLSRSSHRHKKDKQRDKSSNDHKNQSSSNNNNDKNKKYDDKLRKDDKHKSSRRRSSRSRSNRKSSSKHYRSHRDRSRRRSNSYKDNDRKKSSYRRDESSSRRHRKDRDRRSPSRKRNSSRSKRDRHHSSKRKRRNHSNSSSSSSTSPSSSVSRNKRGRRRSNSNDKRKLTEADLRRIERERRTVGEYYSQMKRSSRSVDKKKKGRDDKFIDSNNMQIDTEKFFWDGFCWQPRISKEIRADDALFKQTEKQRKIQLQNVPLHLGLDKYDIISYMNHFMKEHHLANDGNDNPVINCEINEDDRTANIEFSSVEETNLMYKLTSFKFFQTECKIFRICDNHLTQPSIQALTQLAIRQAEAQAAVIKATESIMFQDKLYESEKQPKEKIFEPISTIIKVTNTIELGTEGDLTEENWEDLHADLIEEFERYGSIIFHFIIRPYQATVGAKAGTLFIEYLTKESVILAMQTNDGRAFNLQNLKLFNITEDGFNVNFKPLISIRQ